MWKPDIKIGPAALALAMSLFLILTACGGDSSSGGGGSAPPSSSQPSGVSGPLDELQQPISDNLFGTLSTALAGTGLETYIACVDQVLINDLLDVLDAVLVQIQAAGSMSDPSAVFAASESDLQLALTYLQGDMQALESAMTGAECAVPSDSSGDPLANTDFAALSSAADAVLANDVPGDISGMSSYMSQLSTAFDPSLIGAGASDVVILEGVTTALDTALADLASLFQAMNGGDATAAAAAASATINNLLDNILTGIVPVQFLEQESGTGALFSSLTASEVDKLSALIGTDFSGVPGTNFDADLASKTQELLAPITGYILQTALSSPFDTSLTTSGVTGTSIDALLDPLTDIQTALLNGPSSGTLTGQPIDFLLLPIVDALENNQPCPLAGTYLEPVCTVVQDLLTLISGGVKDIVGELTTLINDLLSP